MRLLAFALAGATACVALPALAQTTQTTPTTPWYAGASVGNVHYHGPDIGGLATDRTGGGGKVWGGWQFHPNFAAELGYADIGKTGSPAGDAKTKGFFIDGVGLWPFTDQLTGLARIGAYWARTDLSGPLATSDSDRSTKIKYGVGLQWNFNPQFGARLEYERYDVDVFDHDVGADMYTLGVNVRF
jgi:OOP family OmpA-OmpF porin